MLNYDWLDKVYNNLEERLYGICPLLKNLIDSEDLLIKLNKEEKEPKITLSLRNTDNNELKEETMITVVYFDPFNQFFYSEVESADSFKQEVRIIFRTADSLIEFIHQKLHNHVESIKFQDTTFKQDSNVINDVPDFLTTLLKFGQELKSKDNEGHLTELLEQMKNNFKHDAKDLEDFLNKNFTKFINKL